MEYVQHVMLGVSHHVGRQRVEGEEVGHLCLLLAPLVFSLADDIGVDHLVSGQKVVLDVLVGVVELHHEFPTSTDTYDSPSFRSLATPKTSFLVIGLRSRVSSSGMAYSFLTMGSVWFWVRAENLTSISFLGLIDLW
jgi:hypothetical protein